MTLQILEQYVLDAESAFEQQEYLQGRELLERALEEEPTYGKAHNHLGWLYLFQLNEFEKAETHLKLALKYAAGYSAPYKHMSSLLFDAKRLDEHEKLLQEARKVAGITNSFIYNDLGRNEEVRGRYRHAIKQYKLGIRWSMDQEEIIVLKENIRRCRDKKWLFLFR